MLFFGNFCRRAKWMILSCIDFFLNTQDQGSMKYLQSVCLFVRLSTTASTIFRKFT